VGVGEQIEAVAAVGSRGRRRRFDPGAAVEVGSWGRGWQRRFVPAASRWRPEVRRRRLDTGPVGGEEVQGEKEVVR
jgi:hypothetical protein